MTLGRWHRPQDASPTPHMVPSRKLPYQTRPPGTPLTLAAGLRLWRTPLPEDFSSRNLPSEDPLKKTWGWHGGPAPTMGATHGARVSPPTPSG